MADDPFREYLFRTISEDAGFFAPDETIIGSIGKRYAAIRIARGRLPRDFHWSEPFRVSSALCEPANIV